MRNTLVSIGIGLGVSAYLYGVKSGWNMLLNGSPRTTFIAFLVIGMALCSVGIGHSVENMGWTNPLVLLGMVFGLINLIIVFVAFTGDQVWFINDYATATLALGGSMVIKAILKVAMNLIYL